jgi:hypothetical protein
MSAPEVGQEQPAGGDLLPPAFSQDPAAYLASVAAQPTSRQALSQLAGPVAAWIANPGSNLAFLHLQQPAGPAAAWIANPGSNLAFLYLQAAAKQLIGDVKVGDVEQEMIRAQQQYEILEVRMNTNERASHLSIYRGCMVTIAYSCFSGARLDCLLPVPPTKISMLLTKLFALVFFCFRLLVELPHNVNRIACRSPLPESSPLSVTSCSTNPIYCLMPESNFYSVVS